MKHKIIKIATLLIFASFIGAFVWYSVYKTDRKTVAEPNPTNTSLAGDTLKKDTLPVVADGTEAQNPVAEAKEKMTNSKTDASHPAEKRIDDPLPPHMMAGSKSMIVADPLTIEEPVPVIVPEEKTIRMMGGSKSVIMTEPLRFDFQKKKK